MEQERRQDDLHEQARQGRGWHGDSEGHAKAGRKGGEAVSKDREHMSKIGRKGGEASRSGSRQATNPEISPIDQQRDEEPANHGRESRLAKDEDHDNTEGQSEQQKKDSNDYTDE